MLLDGALGFTLPRRNARGRLVRLGPVLGQILAAHDYPAPVSNLLAEAVVLAALMGALLKGDGGQLTLQSECSGGAVEMLVCDYRNGEVRGYVRHDAARVAALGADAALADLCDGGFLAITFDLAASGERYQGIVPMEGASLAEACEGYFAQSEQVPTLIRIARSGTGAGQIAGGLLVQHLAEGEEGRERLHVRMDHPEWEHVAVLAGSVRGAELSDAALPLDDLLWRLFHEEPEIRVVAPQPLLHGCRCSAAHFAEVLGRFPESERVAMRDGNGTIPVDCAFCARLFAVAA